MTLLVYRSAPVSATKMRPMGKRPAAMVLIRPGAFSWYQGAVLVERVMAHPKPRRGPASTLFHQSLSRRVLAFFWPTRERSSMVCSTRLLGMVAQGH